MRPKLAVVYDQGAASPTQIAQGLRNVADIQFMVPRTSHVTVALPLLEHLGRVVMIDRVQRTITSERVDGIVTFSERMLSTTASLAALLQIPYQSAESVELLTDKVRQRQTLVAADVDTVRFVPLEDPDQLQEAVADIGFPVVVKPRRGEASRHTYPVADANEAAEVRTLLTKQGVRELIVEEMLMGRASVDGVGDYVSVEVAVAEGHPKALAVTGKFAQSWPFRETGDFWPAMLTAQEIKEVADLAERACRALKVSRGLCHVEVKLTPSGPRLIEVNGRMGGNIAELALRSTGVDMIEVAGKIALGQGVELKDLIPERVYFQYHRPAPDSANRLVRVQGQDKVHGIPGITSYRVIVTLPTELPPKRTFYFDELCGAASSHEAMLHTVRKAQEALTYDFS